jgi:hypothetical protein
MATIQIPYNLNPRPYQIELFNALSLSLEYKRVAFCMRRRISVPLLDDDETATGGSLTETNPPLLSLSKD